MAYDELDEYDDIASRSRNDKLEIVKGTKLWNLPDSDYYKKVKFVEKARRPATPESLVTLFLNEDEDGPCPQELKDQYLGYAKDFLAKTKYRTNEHRDLLVLAFTKYLQKTGAL